MLIDAETAQMNVSCKQNESTERAKNTSIKWTPVARHSNFLHTIIACNQVLKKLVKGSTNRDWQSLSFIEQSSLRE